MNHQNRKLVFILCVGLGALSIDKARVVQAEAEQIGGRQAHTGQLIDLAVARYLAGGLKSAPARRRRMAAPVLG